MSGGAWGIGLDRLDYEASCVLCAVSGAERSWLGLLGLAEMV